MKRPSRITFELSPLARTRSLVDENLRYKHTILVPRLPETKRERANGGNQWQSDCRRRAGENFANKKSAAKVAHAKADRRNLLHKPPRRNNFFNITIPMLVRSGKIKTDCVQRVKYYFISLNWISREGASERWRENKR